MLHGNPKKVGPAFNSQTICVSFVTVFVAVVIVIIIIITHF
jgi:hypothetical protein